MTAVPAPVCHQRANLPPGESAGDSSHVVDGWEVRKVDEFADGRLVRADREHESGSTRLSEAPVPSAEEIGGDPQFVVGKAAFESVWTQARYGA